MQIERDPTRIGQNREATSRSSATRARSSTSSATQSPKRASARPARIKELRADEQKKQAELEVHATADTRPINHYRLARAIADAVDENTILIGDGGDCVALGSKVIPLSRLGQWLDPGPLGCLGVGAPFAIAAKKLYPDRKVLVLSGDGSFGLNGFDFETCIRFKLPVTVVVANDAAWGQIRGPQVMIFGAERAPATRLRADALRPHRRGNGRPRLPRRGARGAHVDHQSGARLGRDGLRERAHRPGVRAEDWRVEAVGLETRLQERLARLG